MHEVKVSKGLRTRRQLILHVKLDGKKIQAHYYVQFPGGLTTREVR